MWVPCDPGGQRAQKIVIQLEPAESGQYGHPAGESQPPIGLGTIKICGRSPCHCLVWEILSLPEAARSFHHQPVRRVVRASVLVALWLKILKYDNSAL